MLESKSNGNLDTPFDMNVHLPTGCSIRKASLILQVGNQQDASSTWQSFIDKTFYFENEPLHVNEQTFFQGISNFVEFTVFEAVIYQVSFDVTDLIDPNINSYTITPPLGQDYNGVAGIIESYALLIHYEHDLFPIVCSDSYLANLDGMEYMSYPFSDLNPIDLSKSVGFSQNGHRQCDLFDSSLLSINNDTIGAVGGPSCYGALGSFYYENETLYDWQDDTADSLVNGADALADIKSYLNINDSFNALFSYYNPSLPPQSGPGAVKSNSISQFFLAYSTPCDTFTVNVTADTSVCQGDYFQLNATGGQNYEWTPAVGLSCTSCPNPSFIADSTMYYTVQIWNNDSCSVIKTVKITVNELSADSINITPSECGGSNGEIEIYNNSNFWIENSIAVNNDTIVGLTYTGLSTGLYNVTLIDGYGCLWDTVIFIPDTITTNAEFALYPINGEVPFTSDVYNLTSNAQNYSWYINDEYNGSSLDDFTFETGGEYHIELIAWNLDPSCADTFALIVLANELVIPTAFTPDNNQLNDTWELPNLDALYPENIVRVYNRAGNLLYTSKQGHYMSSPWNGKYQGSILPNGSYYYVIDLNQEGFPAQTGAITLVR